MSSSGREKWTGLAVAVLAVVLGTGCPQSITRSERQIVTIFGRTISAAVKSR